MTDPTPSAALGAAREVRLTRRSLESLWDRLADDLPDGRVVWDPSPLRDTPGRTFTPSGYWPVRPLAAPDPTTTPGERCVCDDRCPVHDFEVGPPQDRPPVTTGPLNARIVGIRYADPIVIEDAPTTPPAPVERAEVDRG